MSLQLRISRADTAPASTAADETAGPRRLPLDAILGGQREVIIEHRGEDYRLRLTSKDKLLLTK
jgi:hemin uptake protein HemP